MVAALFMRAAIGPACHFVKKKRIDGRTYLSPGPPLTSPKYRDIPLFGNRDIQLFGPTMNHSLADRSRCNCAALRKASRRMSQFYDEILASSGLKSTQYAMLNEIERRPDQPPTMREMADALMLDQSTIGQNLRPLERDGLVSLEQDPNDRRRRYVKLTRKGKSRFAIAQPLWSDAQTRFENSFGKQKAANLRAILLDLAEDAVFAAESERWQAV
jgi:DNA-binding MarR family transcriptional regulator